MNNRIGYIRLKELNFELERRELGVLCKNVLPFGSITEKKLKNIVLLHVQKLLWILKHKLVFKLNFCGEYNRILLFRVPFSFPI